jgi:3-methyladenine DNA glycosylase AlkD
MSQIEALIQELGSLADPDQARQLSRFFKTAPGQYGEGDRFLGIQTPPQRALAKKYRDLPLNDLAQLLNSGWHEHRLTGLLIVLNQYQRGRRAECFAFLLGHLDAMNNWDLVDVIVPGSLGDYCFRHPEARPQLQIWIRSSNLWERRIALLTSFAFIREREFSLILNLAGQVLQDSEDLIHKASGWMLREAGKRNPDVLTGFLEQYADQMPRTMLRYAIEKLSPEQRLDYLNRKKRASSKTRKDLSQK